MKKDIVDLRKGHISLQESHKTLEAELRVLMQQAVENLDAELQNIKQECKDEMILMNVEFGQVKNEYKTLKCEYLIANNIYEEAKKKDDIKKRVYGK